MTISYACIIQFHCKSIVLELTDPIRSLYVLKKKFGVCVYHFGMSPQLSKYLCKSMALTDAETDLHSNSE